MKRLLLVTLLLLAACGPGAEVKDGRELYLAYGCAACHGERGNGRGPAAELSPVKPRDLRDVQGFRGTQSVEGIAGTIAFGVAGGRTGMPGYPDIPRHERVAMARWILTLAAEPREVTADDAWIAPSNPWNVAAAYVTLTNATDREVSLTGVQSPSARVVEMHETKILGGAVATMVRVESIAVPPNGVTRLEPNGTHLMLVDATVRAGDSVLLTLTFDDGTIRTVNAPVRAAGGAPASGAPASGAPAASAGDPSAKPPAPPQGPRHFTLIDENGHTFRSTSLRGKPALLFFGYTHCPDACPTVMSRIARAYREAGPAANGIPTLFVSVDPRDTPPVLKQYLTYFGAVPAKGLTGTKQQIDHVVAQFGARYEIRDSGSAAGPLVDHTLSVHLIDKDGRIAKTFDPNFDPAELAQELEKP